MAKRDLKLNSISRYSKESPQFILEEHGHCEVPAGCGGVVLRWTNPHRSIPVEFWLQTTCKARIFLDGTSLRSGRPLVAYGDHVIGFALSEAKPPSPILMFAGIYDEEEMTHTNVSRKTGKRVSILSTDDGSWKYAMKEPEGDSWMAPGFDDSSWKSMELCDFPDSDENQYRLKKLRELGARGLTVQEKADRIWIRKSFSLSLL